MAEIPFTEGDYIRFRHHDGTGRGNAEAPIFRVRPAISYVHENDTVTAVEDGLERLVVVPHPPYRINTTLPLTRENASQFVKCDIPFTRPVPSRTTKKKRGTR